MLEEAELVHGWFFTQRALKITGSSGTRVRALMWIFGSSSSRPGFTAIVMEQNACRWCRRAAVSNCAKCLNTIC